MGRFQTLLFHRVAPPSDGVFEGVCPTELEKKLTLLRCLYRIAGVREALESIKPGKYFCIRPQLCLTLDDGYADNYKYGFPIFKKLGVKPTIFLATGPLETGEPLWHDKMFTAFARTRLEKWGFKGRDYPLEEPNARAAASEAFAAYVRRLPERARDDAVEALCRELGVSVGEAADRTPMLTWDQIAEMAEGGVEFGAHTVTHPILSTLSPERQEEEIRGSIETIHRRLGLRPRLFAYPNGKPADFTEDTLKILESLGVEAAFTTVRGVNKSNTSLFQLHRGAGWAREPFTFFLQTARCMVWGS